jgi:hypothetical protein
MQFIEKNSLNVRSAIYHLKKDDSGLEFVLFPMIHVGSKEFYDEVSRRLAACDLILAEGVDSKKGNLLTLSYRIVKKIRRMDLVTQQEGMKVSRFREKVVNPDMEGRAFDEHWSALPFSLKAQLFFFIPVYVIYLFLFGTRETLAENIALEDLPSSDEILFQDESFEKLDGLLIDERDRRLIDSIGKLHDSNRQGKKTVGVVYGAMHMRNVISFLLRKLNYRVAKAEWVTVFDL